MICTGMGKPPCADGMSSGTDAPNPPDEFTAPAYPLSEARLATSSGCAIAGLVVAATASETRLKDTQRLPVIASSLTNESMREEARRRALPGWIEPAKA